MNELHGPWLEIAVFVPLLGAGWVRWARSPAAARRWTLGFLGISLAGTICDWIDFSWLDRFAAHDRWDLCYLLLGRDWLVVDELTAPLLALVALLGFLTVLATLRTKVDRVSYGGVLLGQSCCLALFSVEASWLVVALLALSVLPLAFELRSRNKSTRVYWLHMGTHVVLLVLGWGLSIATTPGSWLGELATGILVVSILIRAGIAPLHCWVADVCEHATFGGAILFLTPMAGAYAAVRLLLPSASGWALAWLAFAAVVTAVYAAGLALVQRDARRFFCYLFLSHSALVLVGLETVTPEALTGGLCVWFAASLSLAGFGLTLRSVESRMGRLTLTEYHGLYEHMPSLAMLFLLTGLASVGFPGTIGFVAMELLIDGVMLHNPWFGWAMVAASALNGIAILGVYFRLFTGKRRRSSISLQVRPAERIAVLSLIVLMVGGGVFPQPFLASRLHAAGKLIEMRQLELASHPPSEPLPFLESSPLTGEAEGESEPQNSGSQSLLRIEERSRTAARRIAQTRQRERNADSSRRDSLRARPRSRDASSDD